MPRRYYVDDKGQKVYLPDNEPLDAGTGGPADVLLSQYRTATAAGAGPLKPPMAETFKTVNDMVLGSAGASLGAMFPPPLSAATIPLGNMAGQAASDAMWGTPPREAQFNALLAGGAPMAGQVVARGAGALAGISRGNILDTMRDALIHPLQTFGGLRVTRPGVGLARGAEAGLAGRMSEQLDAEMAKPSLPVSQRQANQVEGILDKYRGMASIDPDQLKTAVQTALDRPGLFTKDMQTAQGYADFIAQKIDDASQTKVLTGRGQSISAPRPLDLAEVEEILDQVRASTDFTTETAESSLKNSLYESISQRVDEMVRAEITNPADRQVYDITKAAMKVRLDARDALRKEVGRLVQVEQGGDFYKGMNSFVRRINQPTPVGEVADKVLRQYDATHGTDWYWQAKRLNIARAWSPDDRVAARTLWSIFRAELSQAGIPLAAKLATEATIAAPVAVPPIRDYLGKP